MRIGRFGVGGCILSLWLMIQISGAQDVESFVQENEWSCISAGLPVEFVFRDNRERTSEVTWVLTINGRTLDSGRAVRRAVDAGGSEVLVKLVAPEIKEGVVIDVVLELRCDGERAAKQVWVYGSDPFVARQAFLEKLRILLFDSDGQTESVLKESRVPFQRLHSIEAIDRAEEGLIIVGEGISLERHPRLAESLVAANLRGLNVLVLAFADGNLKLKMPKDVTDGLLYEIVLQRNRVIHQFDKRFDSLYWSGNSCVSRRFGFCQANDAISIVASDAKIAWPWIQFSFQSADRQKFSELIVCGFGIVQAWNEGPVAKLLFWRII